MIRKSSLYQLKGRPNKLRPEFEMLKAFKSIDETIATTGPTDIRKQVVRLRLYDQSLIPK
ncbi:MAG: hypothetical protein WA474_14135 [Candidatus Sulfotelmatobacter sp.]